MEGVFRAGTDDVPEGEAAMEAAESQKKLELLLGDEKIRKIIRKRGYEL